MQRLAIIGATGQVGTALCAEAARRGVEVVRAARKPPYDLRVDLEDDGTLAPVLATKPAVVIVAAGYTWVDGAEREPERAYQVNARAIEELAELCRLGGTRLVYYSTDYVFDGTHDPYAEDAVTAPASVYGKSKREGELAVLALPDGLVLRTSVVYGVDPAGKNFVYQLRRAARDGQPLRVASDQRSNPTYTTELAWATFELLARGVSGIVHTVGARAMTRPELGELVGEVFGFDARAVMAVAPTAAMPPGAPRPLHCSLADAKLRGLLGRGLVGPDEGLRRLQAELET